MGGDGSVSLPLPRAAASRYPGMVAVHLDAHTDSYAYDPNDEYNSAPQFTHAAEEQCIIASLSYHLGIRGTTYVQGAFEKARSLDYNIITLRELFARRFADVLAELHESLKGRPVYLCRGVVSRDLSTIAGARTLADEVNELGRLDAVIHNAGIGYRERRVETEPGVPSVFAVNVLAP